MSKISLDEFSRMLDYDVVNRNACIEIEFEVDNNSEYNSCWLGKMPDRYKDCKVATYWYGLVPDGSQAYDYPTKDEFLNAKVFKGQSIIDIWDTVTLFSIDGCDVEYRLPHLLGIAGGPTFGPPMPIE